MLSFLKKYSVFILLSLSLSAAHAERTVLKGKIIGGPKPEIALLMHPPYGGLTPDMEYKQELTTEGNFAFVLDLQYPQTGVLTYRNMDYLLFLMPGDSLFYEFEFSGVRMSSMFSGRGEGHNTSYLLIRQEFEQLQSADQYLANLPRNTTPFSFDRMLREAEQKQFAYLERMSDMRLAPEYVDVEKNNIRYGNALLKHNFFMGYTLDNGGRYEDYWPQSVEQLLKLYPLESPFGNALFSPAYREYLKLVLLYWYKEKNAESGELAREEQIERKWALVEKHFPRQAHDYLYAYLILGKYPDPMQPTYTALSRKEYEYWQSRYRERSLNTYIWKLLETERIARYGKNAGTADVLTPESLAAIQFLETEATPLEAFTDFVNRNNGKVILVDFWASWCQPCLAVSPQIRQLQEEYQNENMRFLFVSFDESREKWRKMAWKQRLRGTHLLGGGFESDLARQFGVQALPHYMLIGKNGQINFLRAASPSDTERLRNQINSLLY